MGRTYSCANGNYAPGVAFHRGCTTTRTWLLNIIPWFRPTSAYGYAQVIDETWDDYLDKAGSWGADRDEFADAADFIGWYGNISHSRLGISKGTQKIYISLTMKGTAVISAKVIYKKHG